LDSYIKENEVKLIIIDSFTALADYEFVTENNEIDYFARKEFITTKIRAFKKLIFEYNLFFILVNNVSSKIDGGGEANKNSVVPNLGYVFENKLNTRILLRKEGSKRFIEIIFSNYLDENKAEYIIDNSGLKIIESDMSEL
jgi:hypothetical protein